MSEVIKGVSLAFLSALSIAFVPNLAKLAYQSDVSVYGVLVSRGLVMLLLLLPFIVFTVGSLKIATLKSSFYSGTAFALMSFGYIGGVNYMDVGLVAIIYFSHPILIMIYQALIDKRSLSFLEGAAVFMVTIGLFMTIGLHSYNLTLLGVICAILASVSCAGMIVLNSEEIKKRRSPLAINYQMVAFSTLLLYGSYMISGDKGLMPDGNDGLLIVFVLGFCFTVGLISFFFAFKFISHVRATFITLLQPVFIVVIDFFVFDTQLAVSQYVGGGLIVFSIVLCELSKKESVTVKFDPLLRKIRLRKVG